MKNERQLRLLLVLAVAAIHVLLLIFIVIKDTSNKEEESESARLMKLLDFEEIPPPPEEEEILPMVESIAEVMIETETEPVQVVVAPGTLTGPIQAAPPAWDDYVSQGKVSEVPKFDEREIASSIVYPPIALRSGIEGRVILELFVDRNGAVQRIIVIKEDPEDRGFADAAVRAFTGKQGAPAKANGEPVSSRFRYPVVFKIK